MISRRRLLKQFLLGAFSPPVFGDGTAAAPALSNEDDALLEAVVKSAFLFFWEQANPGTGLVVRAWSKTDATPRKN
jgi:hypothetical protein